MSDTVKVAIFTKIKFYYLKSSLFHLSEPFTVFYMIVNMELNVHWKLIFTLIFILIAKYHLAKLNSQQIFNFCNTLYCIYVKKCDKPSNPSLLISLSPETARPNLLLECGWPRILVLASSKEFWKIYYIYQSVQTMVILFIYLSKILCWNFLNITWLKWFINLKLYFNWRIHYLNSITAHYALQVCKINLVTRFTCEFW